jgi:hypothetical protein
MMLKDIIAQGYIYQSDLGRKKIYYSSEFKNYKLVDEQGRAEDFDMGGRGL